MMRRRRMLLELWRDDAAVAAAEMALIVPLLMILLFGSFEMGKYFLDGHVVAKAVRDGARYASRQGFSEYDCTSASGTVTADVEGRTRSIVRFGKPFVTDTDAPRLSYWGASRGGGQPTVELTVDCPDALGAEPKGGLYAGMDRMPVVTVSAVVDYDSLFGLLDFAAAGITVRARSQSAVMGI
jgi:hypothetical protein